eukprot:TRINITY_DN34797_c0_g1_i1.p1 TRINITY_DN34797_c0_g1~~TRINITY_DN34797_c0_g1_i1.p1  ORF type:complete len:644 (+),score=174.38 TRINITY_DN34797_c0_g1_i1:135-2066(+)
MAALAPGMAVPTGPAAVYPSPPLSPAASPSVSRTSSQGSFLISQPHAARATVLTTSSAGAAAVRMAAPGSPHTRAASASKLTPGMVYTASAVSVASTASSVAGGISIVQAPSPAPLAVTPQLLPLGAVPTHARSQSTPPLRVGPPAAVSVLLPYDAVARRGNMSPGRALSPGLIIPHPSGMTPQAGSSCSSSPTRVQSSPQGSPPARVRAPPTFFVQATQRASACAACGNVFMEDSNFCRNCGAPRGVLPPGFATGVHVDVSAVGVPAAAAARSGSQCASPRSPATEDPGSPQTVQILCRSASASPRVQAAFGGWPQPSSPPLTRTGAAAAAPSEAVASAAADAGAASVVVSGKPPSPVGAESGTRLQTARPSPLEEVSDASVGGSTAPSPIPLVEVPTADTEIGGESEALKRARAELEDALRGKKAADDALAQGKLAGRAAAAKHKRELDVLHSSLAAGKAAAEAGAAEAAALREKLAELQAKLAEEQGSDIEEDSELLTEVCHELRDEIRELVASYEEDKAALDVELCAIGEAGVSEEMQAARAEAEAQLEAVRASMRKQDEKYKESFKKVRILCQKGQEQDAGLHAKMAKQREQLEVQRARLQAARDRQALAAKLEAEVGRLRSESAELLAQQHLAASRP